MFGIDLIDAGLLPAMIVAAVAGLLSFLSPCVLPIVPPYLAYMSGVSLNDLNEGSRRSSAVLPAIFFVLGLSTVFLILGFAASALGSVFVTYQFYFNTVAAILVMIFGAHFVGVYRIGFLDREARMDAGDQGDIWQDDFCMALQEITVGQVAQHVVADAEICFLEGEIRPSGRRHDASELIA